MITAKRKLDAEKSETSSVRGRLCDLKAKYEQIEVEDVESGSNVAC